MVVIFVIALLTAAAVPVIRPALEGGTMREASRSFTSMLGVAKARAQETGRDYGIMLQRMPNRPDGSFTIFYAYEPPPWAGGTVGSRVTVASNGDNTSTLSFSDSNDGNSMPNFVKVGDELKLNYRGHRWRVTGVSGSTLAFSSETASGPPDTNGIAVPFQFFRAPVKASGTPVQLPGIITVDLSLSGLGDGVFPSQSDDNYPVILMFGPDGLPSRLYAEDNSGTAINLPVNQNVYFLLGTPDKLGADNLAALENIWVAVIGQTGLIVSAENAGTNDVKEARKYAQSGQSMVGG